MQSPKSYFFYIMANRSKTLYTGITNSLIRLMRQHKMGGDSRFASKYKVEPSGRQPLFEKGILLSGRTAAPFPPASLSGEGSEGGVAAVFCRRVET